MEENCESCGDDSPVAECSGDESVVASWQTTPKDLRLQIVELLPMLGDAGRLSLVSRGCSDLVEEAMRDRLLGAMRGRRGGRFFVEMEAEAALPAGARSWVRLFASRRGLLPSDERLRMSVAAIDGDGITSGGGMSTFVDGDGTYVASSGVSAVESFDDLDLKEDLMRGVNEYGIENLSTLQKYAVKPIAMMRDALVQAPSGSGKTMAYAIGLLQNIDPRIDDCQALVLVSTRCRAANVGDLHRVLGAPLGVATSYQIQDDVADFRNGGIHVVVGTPAWVYDMINRDALVLGRVQRLVLEADDLLWHGFRDQIYDIFQALPLTVRVGIFTSTLQDDVLRLVSNVLPRGPVRIRLHREELTLECVRQLYLVIPEEHKLDSLRDLCEIFPTTLQAIVYVTTNRKAEWLMEAMRGHGVACFGIYRNTDDQDYERIAHESRSSDQSLIITDDLSAHLLPGDENQSVRCVINFDMPTDKRYYIRRIGRKRRLSPRVVAISFVTPEEIHYLRNIEEFYSTEIKEMPMSVADFF